MSEVTSRCSASNGGGVMGKTILGLLLGVSLCFGSIQEVIAASQDRITGAFGLNFYDKLDPNIVETGEGCVYKTSPYDEDKYNNWVKVRPLIPNKMFRCYYVKTTPKLKKIIGIKAIGPKLSKKRCGHNKRMLDEALNKKYGERMGWAWFDTKTHSKMSFYCHDVFSKATLNKYGFIDTTSVESYLDIHYWITFSKSRKLIDQELFRKDQLDSSGL